MPVSCLVCMVFEIGVEEMMTLAGVRKTVPGDETYRRGPLYRYFAVLWRLGWKSKRKDNRGWCRIKSRVVFG